MGSRKQGRAAHERGAHLSSMYGEPETARIISPTAAFATADWSAATVFTVTDALPN